jgi:hypothetical protein
MVDIVLILTYLVVLAAVGTVVWAMVRRWLLHDRSADTSNGIPSRKIAIGVGAFLLLCLLITFLVGSSNPLFINGKSFDSYLWLKAADMFIFTSLTLLIAAVILVVCSNVRNVRSRR